jgi:hypothetical protein
LRDPSAAKFVQPVEYSRLEALQDHAVGALDLPVRPGVRHDCLIDADMVIISEIKELFVSELCAIVGNNRVWDPETMSNISKEEHRLFRLDSCDWSNLNPF